MAVEYVEKSCKRCSNILKVKKGAAHRGYCAECKSALRLDYRTKLTQHRRQKTLKQGMIELHDPRR